MRANEITEIIKLPQSGFNPSKSKMPGFSWTRMKKYKPLPGGSDFLYDVVRDSFNDLNIYVAKKVPYEKDSTLTTMEVAGFMSTSPHKYFPLKNAHVVEAIAVDPEYRGQGIAKSLYGIYLSILKYPLLAGFDQTPGGRRNWLSLANIPGVEVRGYVAINDKYFSEEVDGEKMTDMKKKKFDKLIDNIMNMGGEYLGKTKDVHFFTFDVEPGTGELEAAVKNELKLYGYHDLVNPGLYAMWSGK